MKPLHLIVCLSLMVPSISYAQKKASFPDSLSKAFNLIVASTTDSCKQYRGAQHGASNSSYESTITIPRSTNNRIDIGFMDYPVIFISYTPAGSNKDLVKKRINEIDAIFRKMAITFKHKKYLLLKDEQNSQADALDYKYMIANAPKELANVHLFVRLDKNATSMDGDYQITMGVYTKNK